MFKIIFIFAIFLFVSNVHNTPVTNERNILNKHQVDSIIREWRRSNPEPCGAGLETKVFDDLECDLEDQVVDEIQSYQDVVNDIIALFTSGDFKGMTYDLLAEITDKFGHRLTGSEVLEDSIDWVLAKAIEEGFQAHTETVIAPKWVRNEESLSMISPRVQSMDMLSLGSSVGTTSGGITAEILVVTSFDDLDAHASEAVGKMVVYDVPFTTYSDTVQYRSSGATEAAKVGAVASLVRSVTDFSIDSPHTGTQSYDSDVDPIPAVAITVEDAAMLHRMYLNGDQVILHLSMNAQNFSDIETRNTVIDITGSNNPDEVVVVSGHLDSWDVGTGVMDDAGGCVISWMAGKALMNMNITPSRTFRTLMFTAEEQGVWGGEAYFLAHYNEVSNFQIMMESDAGTFNPRGIGFSGTNYSKCVMQEILDLTQSIGTTELSYPAETPDLGLFGAVGVPRGSLNNENDQYFWFHHSNGDRMDVYPDPTTLDKIAALWTSVSYVLADVSFRLPHEETSH